MNVRDVAELIDKLAIGEVTSGGEGTDLVDKGKRIPYDTIIKSEIIYKHTNTVTHTHTRAHKHIHTHTHTHTHNLKTDRNNLFSSGH